jgi:hypothetical protein
VLAKDVELAAATAHRGKHGGQRQGRTELGEERLDHIGQGPKAGPLTS